MHPQLETLLELQDLKNQRREMEEASEREVQEEVFHLSVDDALHQLDEKIAEIEEQLPAPVLNRYRRIATKHPRVVAPVIRGTCYGCFVSVPTAASSGATRNEDIHSCQSCGRFLYYVD